MLEIFSGIAVGLSCLLLAVLCKTHRNPQRAVIWAGPPLMIGLASLHIFNIAPGILGFFVISILGTFIFIAWAYVYLGPQSFWAEPNIGLGTAVLFSIILLPWFFLYLAVKIYSDYRRSRPEHIEKVWEEARRRRTT